MTRYLNSASRRQRQHGAALLAIVVLVVIGLLAFILAGYLNQHRPQVRLQEAQQRVGYARDALIAFAVTRYCDGTVATVAEALPCPAAADADGAASATCTAAPGRLPWRTLGTGPLRDNAGECLWYTRYPAPDPDGIIAVLHAPGASVGTQQRTATDSSECGNHPNVGDYLEAVGDPLRNDIELPLRLATFDGPDCLTGGDDGDDGDGDGAGDGGDDGADGDDGSDGDGDGGGDDGDGGGDDGGDDGGDGDGDDGGDDGSPTQCEANAQILLGNVNGNNNSCRVMPGNSPSATCQAAADALAAGNCACAAQAQQFINPPCINNFNSPQCQAAIAALQSCN